MLHCYLWTRKSTDFPEDFPGSEPSVFKSHSFPMMIRSYKHMSDFNSKETTNIHSCPSGCRIVGYDVQHDQGFTIGQQSTQSVSTFIAGVHLCNQDVFHHHLMQSGGGLFQQQPLEQKLLAFPSINKNGMVSVGICINPEWTWRQAIHYSKSL